MRFFSTTLLVPATALLATLLLAAKPTSPRAFRVPTRPAAPPSPCPSDMEYVGGKFCIDQFEASTVEVHDDGSTVRHSPFLPVAGLKVKAISKKGLVPQAYIS